MKALFLYFFLFFLHCYESTIESMLNVTKDYVVRAVRATRSSK